MSVTPDLSRPFEMTCCLVELTLPWRSGQELFVIPFKGRNLVHCRIRSLPLCGMTEKTMPLTKRSAFIRVFLRASRTNVFKQVKLPTWIQSRGFIRGKTLYPALVQMLHANTHHTFQYGVRGFYFPDGLVHIGFNALLREHDQMR